MQRQRLSGARLRSAGYDEASRRLEIEFADGALRVYKGVPHEVFRRLLSSPNPGTYWEDRIAEEYPDEAASDPTTDAARSRLDDLFKRD